MFADGPNKGSRTYFLTGFGSSVNYGNDPSGDAPPGIWDINSPDNTVPEFRQGSSAFNSGPADPFAVDVYLLGNMIKRDLIEVRALRQGHKRPIADIHP